MTLAATIARPHLDFSLPFFRIITHLHLQEPMGQGALRPDWPPIWELPALTHLVLSSGYSPETIHTYLAKCEKLLVIVLVWLLIPPPFYDSRVVSTASTPCCDDHEFWHRVEEFMKKKRRGEIEGSSHTLDPHHEIIFCAPAFDSWMLRATPRDFLDDTYSQSVVIAPPFRNLVFPFQNWNYRRGKAGPVSQRSLYPQKTGQLWILVHFVLSGGFLVTKFGLKLRVITAWAMIPRPIPQPSTGRRSHLTTWSDRSTPTSIVFILWTPVQVCQCIGTYA
ncbi:hypothetical protein B0H14DRAFT_3157756 [Mycena olivaceomarginata]|nr:hypothetical protein B0H14DRAFT_3157756 [Mycena olivaceomarginata]